MTTSATADFLVEIGTEELPPKALRRLEAAFADATLGGLRDAGLGHGVTESFAAPRRLALLVRDLDRQQTDREVEKRGPPVTVAFDDAGQPTRAAQAFADGCGVAVAELERQSTPKGEWLYFRGTKAGHPAAELLPDIVDGALASLPIPKRMRWGAGDAEFVRPVHWVVMLLDDQVVHAELLGQAAAAVTRGHRFHAPDPIPLGRAADYQSALEQQGSVVPGFAARRERIVELASAAAASIDGEAVLHPDVVDEVTALVEWPVALAGRFDPEFLNLPEEVLISTLQDHQRYFPVRDADGKLLPHFITISNLDSRDQVQVRAGNERVVRPRLADAAFFFDQDRRTALADRRDALKQVVFEKDLGSLFDKSARVAQLGHDIAADLLHDASFDQTVFQQWVVRAAHLAKTDLLTSMVGEFPELQGRMGYYYAVHDGEQPAVARAIEEQYLPRHAGDRLPATPTGRVLAVADRLDTLAGIFAVGKRPTGNKDPFGLRRAALGLLRILVEDGVELDLRKPLAQAVELQPMKPADAGALVEEIFAFVMDRLRAYYRDGLAPGLAHGAVSAEVLEAVRARNPSSPLDFHQRLTAVQGFLQLPEADSLAQANKRIANILRGADEQAPDAVRPELFEAAEERELHEAVAHILGTHAERLERRDYAAVLTELAALRAPVDAFFDGVMVMTDDDALRGNRLALLKRLRHLFLDVADLSLIPA
ncbi:MAG: glycine--tRNA ligase subunit beta [Chromatiales bacterium]|nr:MAG: glycine--tRNA ligase subunit beta [Chromatiales bacterium]